MRAGTISWIVIPFLIASLAASGLGKRHRRGREKIFRRELAGGNHQKFSTHSPPGADASDKLLEHLREEAERPWKHQGKSVNEIPEPASKPKPPPRHDGTKNFNKNYEPRRSNDPAYSESKKSTCLYNLPNETCSESLYCVITEPAKSNDNPVQCNCWLQPIILSVKKRTKCLQSCLNDTPVNFIQCGNQTYRFYPIDSPCNMKAEIVEVDVWDLLETYKYPMAGALGIILLLILIICIVCTVKMKRKNSENLYSDAI